MVTAQAAEEPLGTPVSVLCFSNLGHPQLTPNAYL